MILRAFKFPYVVFQLEAQHLQWITATLGGVRERHPELGRYRLGVVENRMAAQLAFAAVYGKEDQFRKKSADSFQWDNPVDFRHGKQGIKILPSRTNHAYENTAYRTKFRTGKRVLAANKSEAFVLAVFSVPFVQFVGWIKRPDMDKYIQKWGSAPYAGCSSLQPMTDLSIESARRQGVYA